MTDAGEALETDAALAARAKAGGPAGHEAFRALYFRHKDEVCGFLARVLRDDALAEDVLQETFLRVHRGLAGYDAARPFRAWLFQIARHSAVDAVRTRRKDERLVQVKVAEVRARGVDAPDPAAHELAARARGALALLPEETRALLVERFGHDRKLEDLAESWSCTERTIRNRLKTAASLLARAIATGRPVDGGDA